MRKTLGGVAVLLFIIAFTFNSLSNYALLVSNRNTKSIFGKTTYLAFIFMKIGIFSISLVLLFDTVSYKNARIDRVSPPVSSPKKYNTENAEFLNSRFKNTTGVSSVDLDNALINKENRKDQIQLKSQKSVIDYYQQVFSFNRNIKKVFIKKKEVDNLNVFTESKRLIEAAPYSYKIIETRVKNLVVVLREYDYSRLIKVSNNLINNLINNIISTFKYLFEVVVNLIFYCLETILSVPTSVSLFIEELKKVKTILKLIDLTKNSTYQITINLKTWLIHISDFTTKSACTLVNNLYRTNFIQVVRGINYNFVKESAPFQILIFIFDTLHLVRVLLFGEYDLSEDKVDKADIYNLTLNNVNISDELIKNLDDQFELMYRRLFQELDGHESLKEANNFLRDLSVRDIINSLKSDIDKKRYFRLDSRFNIDPDIIPDVIEEGKKKLFMDEFNKHQSSQFALKYVYKIFLETYSIQKAEISTSITVLRAKLRPEGQFVNRTIIRKTKNLIKSEQKIIDNII